VFKFSREKGESLASKLGDQSEFVEIDTSNAAMLKEALQGQQWNYTKQSYL
jgi:hypothetical protein